MKKFLSAAFGAAIIYMCSVSAFALEPAPEIISETAVVIDAKSGQVLYDKNMNAKMYPASTTKVMTGLLAVEKGDLSQNVTASHDAVFSIGSGTSHISLSEGETITLEQALYGLAIESGNDAANVIAEAVGGSLSAFADLMNERAAQLGAVNTHFVNAHGLHNENHYTTAYDLALIARQAVQNETFNKIFSSETFSIPPTNKQSETRTFHSQNWFLNGALPYEGILMSKTGWTGEAQHTMVTAASRGDVTLICVVMKSTSKSAKWNDTEALFDWAFSQFSCANVSGDYIALSAKEETPCTDDKKLVVKKEDIVAQGADVLLFDGLSVNDVKVSFDDIVLSSDMKQADIKATLYLENQGSSYILCTVNATAPVSERKIAALQYEISTSKTSDMFMVGLFSLLTFVAVMIGDILLNKRI